MNTSTIGGDLRLIVMHVDTTMKRYDSIGIVQFPLVDYTRCKKTKLTVWRDLNRMKSAQVGDDSDNRTSIYIGRNESAW
jgi:hypothetical protein